MKVLVTGANGSLGLATARMLVRAGHYVIAFVHNVDEFRSLCPEERVGVFEGDILDRSSVTAVDRADAVVHCAHFPPRSYKLNWDAVRHALEAVRPGGYFIYPGDARIFTGSRNGRAGPDEPKQATGREDEVRLDLERAVLAESGTVVYLAEIYGPRVRGGRLRDSFRRAAAGKTVWFSGALEAPHEFLYIDDAARALTAPVGRRVARGQVYTAPGPGPITPEELIAFVFRSLGEPPRVRSMPAAWDAISRRFRSEPRFPAEFVHPAEPPPLLDGTRIRAELGWVPEVPYEEGVRRTLRWMRSAAP